MEVLEIICVQPTHPPFPHWSEFQVPIPCGHFCMVGLDEKPFLGEIWYDESILNIGVSLHFLVRNMS